MPEINPKARVALYVAAIAAQVTSFFMTAIGSPLATAFEQTANALGVAAGVGAIMHIGTVTTRPKSLPGSDAEVGEHPEGFDAPDPADEVPHGFGLPDPGVPLEPPTDRYADTAPRHAARD